MDQSNNELTLSWLCKYAGVSRSGYYSWVNNPNIEVQEQKDRNDFELILKAYNYRGYNKGVNGIYMRLLRDGIVFNKKKIRRLMRKYGLNCPIRKANPYKRMLKNLATSNYAPNLLNREFKLHGPRYVLLTDITYFFYGPNRIKAYLSVIIDAYTKEVLAYVLSSSLEIDFVLKTINMLLKNHKNELKTDCLIHSDQGCHYTSIKFIKLIKNKNIRQSMSRRGNCWDNAPQESFFGHMKEEIKNKVLIVKSFKELKLLIDDYMDYYNNDRYQWGLSKLSPREYYEFITKGEYPKNNL